MRLDPPGFTGPSTSYDRNNGNDRYSFSSSLPFHFTPRRQRAIAATYSSSFRLRSPVPSVRTSKPFERHRNPVAANRFPPRCSWPHDRYASVGFTANGVAASPFRRRSVDREDGHESKNATASRVFHASSVRRHSRSGVRSRVSTLGNILEKNEDGGGAQRKYGQQLEEVESDEEKKEGNDDGIRDDVVDGNAAGPIDDASTWSSESRESRSRSCYAGSRKPRTRWKKSDREDGAIIGDVADLSRIPTANTANVPSVDAAFPYTAYNEENDDEESYRDYGHSPVASFREIGNVRDGRQNRAEETKFCREVRSGVRTDKIQGTNTNADSRCGRGKRSRKCAGRHGRNRGRWEGRVTREKKSRVESGNGGKCESHYTARFQEPITNESCENETELSTNGPTKISNSCGRKYGLLFILYLLAWPLVCSTNLSGQFVSGFTHNPSLGPSENLSQHNATQISSLLSSSSSSSSSNIAPQRQQQKQRYRQLEEEEHEPREQFQVRDVTALHHRRRHEEQQEEQGREQRQVEESSYRDRKTVLESEAIHPYNEYSWEVNQINPWLSACDLAGPAPADLQGSCGPPEVPKNCPVPCVASPNANGNDAEFLEVIEKVDHCYWSTGEERMESGRRFAASSIKSSGTSGSEEMAARSSGNVARRRSDGENAEGVRMAPEQCLFYLEESHKRDICRDDFGRTSTRSFLTPRENRYWFMSGLRLRHCCEHTVVNALAPGKGGPLENVLNGGQKCADALDKLLLVDALAARLHCEFEEVLARYDCAQPYSVIFNCTHCKEAYRKWVCSSLVPYFAHGGPQDFDSSNSWAGTRLRPCRSFCQSVEQRCPYLLPGDRAPAYPTQYAGEPTFLCRDPNIPETGEQAARALHSSEEDECCFRACSEELSGSGICANCTDREPRKRGRSRDPPTAPRCEINPIHPASTGGDYDDEESESTDRNLDEEEEDRYDSSTDSAASSMTSMARGTLLCGTGGGVSSISSVSSSDRSTASIIPQLFCLCSILTSVLGNVRTIPVLWISKMFLWSVPFGSDNGGSKLKSTSQLIDLVVWLRGCFAGVSLVRVRYGAKWLLEKWVVIEGRWRDWWCCCWYWWWWRWRRISVSGRVRWELRPRRSRAKSSRRIRRELIATTRTTAKGDLYYFYGFAGTRGPITVGPTLNAVTVSVVAEGEQPVYHSHLQRIYRDSLHERSSTEGCTHSGGSLVDSFTVHCPWRRWRWWWWWLYRWWRTNRCGSIERRTTQLKKNAPRRVGRDLGEPAGENRRRRRRRIRGGKKEEVLQVFEEDVRSSPARRRYFKLCSRKDPP